MRCGFALDCHPRYTAELVMAVPDQLAAEAASKLLTERKAAAESGCSACNASRGPAGTCKSLNSGGWCYSSTRPEHGAKLIRLPRNMTYYLPTSHVTPDLLIAAVLHHMFRTSSHPRRLSLNDLGAGVGQMGRSLLSLEPGISYQGYDGAGNVEASTNGFVRWADLTVRLFLPVAEWVLSLEVGEHVPSEFEVTLLSNLHAANCRGIILSWARLGQAGYGHVNNHSPQYIADRFDELGYDVNWQLTSAMRGRHDEGKQRPASPTMNVDRRSSESSRSSSGNGPAAAPVLSKERVSMGTAAPPGQVRFNVSFLPDVKRLRSVGGVVHFHRWFREDLWVFERRTAICKTL